MAKKVPLLKGDALAKAYAATFSHLGKVWGTYYGGGWVGVRGEGLRPHPKLAHVYVNGWSLSETVRAGVARARVREAARG